ncbi:MAG: hypothetical protein IPK13_03845 [Deltaproteobacteria bacterium]|nr:hypothetical protein [Deltaproteobacteria bacterium]
MRRRRALELVPSPLERYVDTLIQSFEDRRNGLTEATIAAGEDACQRFFFEIYEREFERLRRLFEDEEPHLSESALASWSDEIDRLFRTVVIPAYVRLAMRFTSRERNDFYLTRSSLHPVERIGFALLGMVIGGFVLVAPFIPIWQREWILPFMLAGLLFPNLRAYLAIRRYEAELNRLVVSVGREMLRLEQAYSTYGEPIGELKALTKPRLVAHARSADDVDDASALKTGDEVDDRRRRGRDDLEKRILEQRKDD